MIYVKIKRDDYFKGEPDLFIAVPYISEKYNEQQKICYGCEHISCDGIDVPHDIKCKDVEITDIHHKKYKLCDCEITEVKSDLDNPLLNLLERFYFEYGNIHAPINNLKLANTTNFIVAHHLFTNPFIKYDEHNNPVEIKKIDEKKKQVNEAKMFFNEIKNTFQKDLSRFITYRESEKENLTSLIEKAGLMIGKFEKTVYLMEKDKKHHFFSFK